MTTDLDDTLTAAVARLRADANKYPWLSQSHDIIAILAALEAAQADARRYRWLRETPGMGIDMMIERGLFNDNGSLVPLDRLDAAIDAAMGEGT